MSSAEKKFTDAEVEEAMRRTVNGDWKLTDDDTIQEALDGAVEAGFLERKGEGMDAQYRLTDKGKAMAEESIAETLNRPPPRAEAFAHVYTIITEQFDEDAVTDVFNLAQAFITIEHQRLAEFFEGLVAGGISPDANLNDLAKLLREGLL